MNRLALLHAFEEENGILTVEIASRYGVDESTLKKAVEREEIEEYSQGVYFLDYLHFDDLYLVQLKHPQGIYSHDTAMMLHTLTTFSPFVYHLTFPTGHHLPDAKEQMIKMHIADQSECTEAYTVVMDSWESNPIRVTNLEKTIVDTFRTEKLLTFIVKEMINDYIRRSDKDVQRLIEYAEQFHVLDVIEREILPFIK